MSAYWFARLDPSKKNSAFAPVSTVGWFVTFALAAALAVFVHLVMAPALLPIRARSMETVQRGVDWLDEADATVEDK